VYGVWINTLDPRLPRIALFADRDIEKGEELTFDYMMTGTQGRKKQKVPYFTGYKAILFFLTLTPAPIIVLRLFYVLNPMLPLLIIKT
jgi:hypothetical protein